MANITFIASKIKAETDWTLHKMAQSCIAQSYLTNSKRPECFVKGVYPTHMLRGKGCYLWDKQNKKYIDFITGLGTNLLGYANEKITNAVVVDALHQGNLFSLASEQELKTAEKLKEVFPWVDCWKFLKTGGEACGAAIKIALKATPNNKHEIITQGYHGWREKDENYIQDIFYLGEDTAAVIIEPIISDASEDRIKWLREVREKCTNYGVLLIFDEVVTGFRFPGFSASKYYGIEPDLIVIGKAMANGYSLAAVGGKYAVMNQDYFVSSTYSSSMDALVACEQVVTLLQKEYRLEDLWIKGGKFMENFNKLWPEKIKIEGYPTRGVFKGDPEIVALFFQEACYGGILLGPSFFFNFPLMEVSDMVLNTFADIIQRLRLGMVKLNGEAPKPAVAAKMRE
jgi:glutamate-1-semialdehyde 2,1-aminomutase